MNFDLSVVAGSTKQIALNRAGLLPKHVSLLRAVPETHWFRSCWWSERPAVSSDASDILPAIRTTSSMHILN